MCGIAGRLQFHGLGPSAESVVRMAAALAHRGPDDQGFAIGGDGIRSFADPAALLNEAPVARLFLGHRRLSIIDLSPAGHQPMVAQDGRQVVVFNGEIFNFPEIAAELAGQGDLARGNSDTEILLLAYRRWGIKALERLNGMFTFAIWDEPTQSLFCARDRLGEKPFYYRRDETAFTFASELPALLAGLDQRPGLDRDGLFHALSFGIAPRPLTCFANVRALMPGCWMRLNAQGDVEEGRYWALPTGTAEPGMTEADAVALIGEELEAAVRRRLVGDVPVASFLSGGIDSTLITAMAGPGVTAFTISLDGDPGMDETALAAATARKLGIKHVTRSVQTRPDPAVIADMMACYDDPFYDLSPNYLLSEAVAEAGFKVVLAGLGGDELFGGYRYYRWLGLWRLLQLARPMLARGRGLPVVGHGLSRLEQVGAASSGSAFACQVRSLFSTEEKSALFGHPVKASMDTVEHILSQYLPLGIRFADEVEAMSHMELANYIGNHHVQRLDRFTMRFSVEARLPFLDHRVVEAAFRVPSRHKVSGGTGKRVLRRLVEQRVGGEILSAPKKGFDLPTQRWMTGPLRGFVEDAMLALARRPEFDAKTVGRVLTDWRRGARSFRGVWQLVATEMWLRRWIDTPTSPEAV